MSLERGMRLGPYEIQSAAGAGGMGEVYRARDTRLNRTVAVKVLGRKLSERPDLRQRFEREARAVSALNHPNICTLHDVGEHDGAPYLVMEYVEGETLEQRLERGTLAPADAYRMAIQIGEALEEAHRNSIVHRDLKPGNVMLAGAKGSTAVKLLDFGLAKMPEAQAAAAQGTPTTTPTEANTLTTAGTVLGTVQYMAPEQLEGKEADARSDIFSFGAMLFEMMTGRKAFQGRSQASLISAIFRDEPPAVSELRPDSPPALDRVIRRCLTKEADGRWQTVHDLVEEIRWLQEGGGAPAAVAAARRRPILPWTAAAVFAAAAAMLAVAYWRGKPAAMPVSRLTMNIAGTIPQAAGCPPAISADGSTLAYAANNGSAMQIYVRRLNEFSARALEGTQGGGCPFLSPDGNWVGFYSDGRLKKIPAEGGAPQTICDVQLTGLVRSVSTGLMGASWAADGTIVFAQGSTNGLSRVPASGGTPKQLTTPDPKQGQTGHVFPQVLPNGRGILFSIFTTTRYGNQPVAVAPPEGGTPRIVSRDYTYARYVQGELIGYRDQTLFAAPFDLDRLEVKGPAVSILEGVAMGYSVAAVPPLAAFSDAGTLAYVPDDPRTRTSALVWVDAAGNATPVGVPEQENLFPVLSRDGRLTAMAVTQHRGSQLWLWDNERGSLSRLTFDGDNHAPIWSPDGNWIVYSSDAGGAQMNLHRKRADGSGAPERLTTSVNHQDPGAFTPDGKLMTFAEFNAVRGKYEIWLYDFERRESRPLLQTAFDEEEPTLSADGKWMVYQSNESGRVEIYVRRFPEGGRKWQVSTEGGGQPLWSPDGRAIYFRTGARMMSVAVEAGPEPRLGRPRELFMARYKTSSGFGRPGYDISPDGKRFLMLRSSLPDGQGATAINVILNWAEELRKAGRVAH